MRDAARHPEHVWHQGADGRVRCAEMDCPATPSALDVERLAQESARAAAMRIEIEFRAQ